MNPIKLFRWLLLIGLTACCAAVLGATGNAVTNPVSDYGTQLSGLFWLVMAICGAFFALVITIMAIVFFRFRAKRAEAEGKAVHGNVKLEILWTAVPLALMVWLAFVSADLVNYQLRPPPSTLIVKVVAYQFGWDYEYYQSVPNGTGADLMTIKNICGNPASMVTIRKLNIKSTNDFTLPVNTPVRFLVSSRDVIHSFWIPDFLIKRDTVPGLVADLWLTPDTLGDFRVVCAALCGPDHAVMTGTMRVVSAEAFAAWSAEHAVAPAPQASPDSKENRT